MLDLVGDVTNNGIRKRVFTILPAVAEAERGRIGFLIRLRRWSYGTAFQRR
jgi:hypothetical protein